MEYDEGLWFIICSVVTGLGVVGAFFAFARRGAASGFRVLGWALLPLAAALTGVVGLLWTFGVEIVSFVGNFILSTSAWVGLAMFVFSFLVLGGAAFLRRRNRGVSGGSEQAAASSAKGEQAAPQQVEQGKGKKSGKDDSLEGFEEIEDILKNRGIS